MRVELGALGSSLRAFVEDSGLRTQATTMLLGRWRKAAIRPFPMPVFMWKEGVLERKTALRVRLFEGRKGGFSVQFDFTSAGTSYEICRFPHRLVVRRRVLLTIDTAVDGIGTGHLDLNISHCWAVMSLRSRRISSWDGWMNGIFE